GRCGSAAKQSPHRPRHSPDARSARPERWPFHSLADRTPIHTEEFVMSTATFFRHRHARPRGRPVSTRLQVDRLEHRLVPSTTWVEQGPGPIFGSDLVGIPGSPVAGAIAAIAVNPTNADIVYAGSVNGGVWKTTDATAANPTWTPLTDLQLPEISINSP